MAGPTPTGDFVDIEIGHEENVGVLGMRGTGKTSLMLRELLPRFREEAVAWDPVVDAEGRGQYPPEISYRPSSPDAEAEFERLVTAIWNTKQRKRLFIEEAEEILPEAGPKVPPAFKQYAMVGRNFEMSFVLNARRAAGVSKWPLSQCDHLLIFKLEGVDRDYMRRHVGRDNYEVYDRMRRWVKDPREPGGGRFFWYHDGELVDCDPIEF